MINSRFFYCTCTRVRVVVVRVLLSYNFTLVLLIVYDSLAKDLRSYHACMTHACIHACNALHAYSGST